MLKAVFFDLDGTLLRITESDFTKVYFSKIIEHVHKFGIKPETMKGILYSSLEKMYKNNGEQSNADLFWKCFYNALPKEDFPDTSIFDEFYNQGYLELGKLIEKTEIPRKIVDFCKENGLITVLSTNPFFPKVGQLNRIGFIGLKSEDFAYITDYENSNYSKPNPMFFKMLLDKFQLKPEEVIVIGNNEVEDGACASSLGIKTYLVKGYIIKDKNASHDFIEIEYEEIIDTIKKEIQNRR